MSKKTEEKCAYHLHSTGELRITLLLALAPLAEAEKTFDFLALSSFLIISLLTLQCNFCLVLSLLTPEEFCYCSCLL
jgi:hypothetical protein